MSDAWGSWAALPTPFRGDHVDFDALRRLIEVQVAGRTAGLVVAGPGGEAETLEPVERLAVIEFAARVAAGRIPVFAGVGTDDTRTTVLFGGNAQASGCDGLFVRLPAAGRPTQRGLCLHLERVAERTPLPLVVHNDPLHGGVDLAPESAAALAARHPNVVAICEESSDARRYEEHRERGVLALLCAEDARIPEAFSLGARGIVSSAANLVPSLLVELVAHAAARDERRAKAALAATLAPLLEALALEPSAAALKAGLALLGLCTDEVRSPLVSVEPTTRRRLERALTGCGIVLPEGS